MKKVGVLAAAMAAAFLFVGVASAEMYVEGYIGGGSGPKFEYGDLNQRSPQSWWHGTLQV